MSEINKVNRYKFNEVFTRIVKKNTNNNTNILTISAQYGLINQEEFFNKIVASKNLSGYYLLEKGDFAYNKSYSKDYPMGAIKKLNRYDSGIVSPLYICFRINNENVSSQYMEYYFESGILNREIYKIAQEGARNHGLLNISVNEFFEDINLYIPQISKQEKIVKILSTWDSIIQKKEELITTKRLYKEVLMEKVFSGEKRLNKFSDKWVERKIGTILQEDKEIAQNPDINKRLTVRLNLKGIEKREIKNIEIEGATTHYVRKAGQFIYGKQNFHKGAFAIIPDELDGYQSSSDIPAFNINSDIYPMWLYYYFSRQNYYKNLEKIATGTGSKRIQPKSLFEIKIKVPSYSEQIEIARMFMLLDREIKLLEEEKDLYKEQKKNLLTKFINV